MDAMTKASRAVLAEYARKTLKPVEIVAASLFALALLGTSALIANVSGWWWLLMIIVIAYGVIGSIVWLVVHFTIDKIRPVQSAEQKKAVGSFISQLDKTSNVLGMTKFGMLLRIIGDVMRRNEKNVISKFTHDSSKLKTAFEQLVQLFR